MSLSRPTAFSSSRRRTTRTVGFATFLLVTALAAIAGQPAIAALPTGAAPSPVAGQASAPGGCPSSPTSNVFASFGDKAAYSAVPGGSFESGTSGWSLSNAAVAAEGESYNVVGGSHSLAIQPNGVAVSPSLCVSTANPTFRFFARRTSGSWGVLNVVLRWTDSAGATHDTTVASLQSGTKWVATSVLPLATTLPLWQAGSTLSTKLVFKPETYGGAWELDDAFVDPRMR